MLASLEVLWKMKQYWKQSRSEIVTRWFSRLVQSPSSRSDDFQGFSEVNVDDVIFQNWKWSSSSRVMLTWVSSFDKISHTFFRFRFFCGATYSVDNHIDHLYICETQIYFYHTYFFTTHKNSMSITFLLNWQFVLFTFI